MAIGRTRRLFDRNDDFSIALRDLDRRRPNFDLGTVADDSDRPPAEQNPGRVVFVRDQGATSSGTQYYSDGTAWRDVVAGSSSFTTPSIILGTSAAVGSGSGVIHHNSTIAAFDATDPADVGLTAVVGSVALAARRDHVHKIGTGTPDGSKFLRDDLAWTAVAGGGGQSTHIKAFVATGDTLTVPTKNQVVVCEQYILEGTGAMVLEGTALLHVIAGAV